MDLVQGVALVESLGEGVDTGRSGVSQLLIDILHDFWASLETLVTSHLDGSESFLKGFFPGSTNGHDLTDRFHLGAELRLHTSELVQIPSRDLGNDVIERRLEAGRGGLGDGVTDLRERNTQAELGSDESDRVSGGLGGEGRRPRQTRVYLNDVVGLGVGVESVLDITLTNDSQVADYCNSGLTQHVIFRIGEGLGRSNYNGFSRVNTHRIEVLHVTNGDTVVIDISDDFVLNLFPAFEGFLDENLRAGRQSFDYQLFELLIIIGKSGAEASQSKGSTDDDGVSDLVRGSLGGLKVNGGDGRSGRLVDLSQSGIEQLSVFGDLNSLGGGTQDLDSILSEDPRTVKFKTAVKTSLTPKAQQDTVRSFAFNNLLYECRCDRQEVDLRRVTDEASQRFLPDQQLP